MTAGTSGTALALQLRTKQSWCPYSMSIPAGLIGMHAPTRPRLSLLPGKTQIRAVAQQQSTTALVLHATQLAQWGYAYPCCVWCPRMRNHFFAADMFVANGLGGCRNLQDMMHTMDTMHSTL
jgi:hypothetical protein